VQFCILIKRQAQNKEMISPKDVPLQAQEEAGGQGTHTAPAMSSVHVSVPLCLYTSVTAGRALGAHIPLPLLGL